MLSNSEKFQIHSLSDIARILRQIQDRQLMIRMSFPDVTGETMIVALLHVDMKNRQLFLERAYSDVQNQMAVKSYRIRFEAVVDKVRVTFRASRVRHASFGGRPVLAVDMPDMVMRFQRRGHDRISVEGVQIRVPLDRGGNAGYATAAVLDVSPLGLTMIDDQLAVGVERGVLLPDCSLMFPGKMPISVNVCTRNVRDMMQSDRSVVRRVGCELMDVPIMVSRQIRFFVGMQEGTLGHWP